ncbi:zf-HC2 domain-containing protein [Viridibacillus arvi]|uniref:zf-HC2 domain-containing protein n=1 Tax=Viridibacillus arvi TaxID=263475 RepID=UPI0036EE2289
MNCNIIKDLLPSYIDEICSEDTAKLVEGHVQHCEECRLSINRMQEQMAYVQHIPEEVEKAITPFKKVKRKRLIQVITAIVMTFIITIVGALVIQEVGPVNRTFFPVVTSVVDAADDLEEWQSMNFNDKNYLIFDSVFWKKEIINSSINESDILLRVKDEKGNVVVDEIRVSPGKSVKLENLKKNKKYFFEIKVKEGSFFINAV